MQNNSSKPRLPYKGRFIPKSIKRGLDECFC